jgi:UDP-N-acetylmuramoyl-tripeptide--D-alanyl-D-alanine ligase
MQISELYHYFLQSSGICTDTRKITPGCLFVALRGDRFDANTFAATALQQGALYARIDNP